MTVFIKPKVPVWLRPQPKRPAHVVADELRSYANQVAATDPDFADQLRKRADELLDRRRDEDA